MNLKAYAWDDEDYGESYLVWTTTPGKAKALLAAEHDREFTEIRVYRVPWADKYMLAWSAVKGRDMASSVSNKKVNSAAIVECKGFKVRERQI